MDMYCPLSPSISFLLLLTTEQAELAKRHLSSIYLYLLLTPSIY